MFADASDSLFKTALSALGDKIVVTFRDAVYAVVGVFDKVFAKEVYASNITADTITSKQDNTDLLCVGSTCVTESQLRSLLNGQTAAAAASQSGIGDSGTQDPVTPTLGGETLVASSTDSATSTPSGETLVASSSDSIAPVITVSGSNPATINVGESYNDLGATVTDNVDHNLGVHAMVDGGAEITLDQIYIDTSATGTHSIVYTSTDQAGNTGTAERTVNVVAPAGTITIEESTTTDPVADSTATSSPVFTDTATSTTP